MARPNALYGRDVVDGADIARVSHSTTRSVARWRAHQAIPKRDVEERLLELKSVLDLLSKVLREEPSRLWLRSPHPNLCFEKPIDLIAEGRYRDVIVEILAMAEGLTA